MATLWPEGIAQESLAERRQWSKGAEMLSKFADECYDKGVSQETSPHDDSEGNKQDTE
jgi:hypothetical protein